MNQDSLLFLIKKTSIRLFFSLIFLFVITEVQAQNGNQTIEFLLAPSIQPDLAMQPGKTGKQWKGRASNGVRSRKRDINPAFQEQGHLDKGQRLSLKIFEDIQVNALVEDHLFNINGTQITSAKIEDSQWGRVFIATTGDTVTAKVNIPEERQFFAIQKNSTDSSHYALELDPDKAQFDSIGVHEHVDVETIPLALLDPPMVSEDENLDATTVIDVMVVYTSGALASVNNSTAEMNNLIALGMAYGNDAHTNSGTGIYLNLVHSQRINYTDSGDRSTDHNWLKNDGDDSTYDVHALRDAHGADFVVMMVGDYASDGGIASLLANSGGDANVAYSVVTSPAFDSYTPVHEIGHNMGLSHADDQNYQAGPTPWYIDTHGFNQSSAGWHWHPVSNQKGYCSIMTYTDGSYFPGDGLSHTRVGLFSDPNISDHGLPSGHATRANNALVLRTLRNVYASYKQRPLSLTPVVIDYPAGGERLTAGSTYNILWDSSGITGNVKIDLFKDGVFNRSITASTLNDRVFSWTVPGDLSGYNYTIRISNLAESIMGESSGGFTINSTFYFEPLDSNPGFTTGSGWEFGIPVTIDNATYGGPDEAYTGTNIYDTNLDGAIFSTSTLTSNPIDCSDRTDVQLSFMAWFSMTSNFEARVEVSNDNTTWHTLYQKSDSWQTAWSRHSYDISAHADGEATVYLRWSHVKTGGSSSRSGMSVDDINLSGVEDITPVQIHFSDGSTFSPPAPLANSINNVIGKFVLTATDTGASLRGLSVDAPGTRQGVASMKLYRSTDGVFSPASDTLLATTVDGSTLTFSGFTTSIPTDGVTFFISMDLALNASGTVSASLGADSDINLDSGQLSANFSNAPLADSTSTITAISEISIKGNGIVIGDGDSTPRPADNTDFGIVNIASAHSAQSFLIENQGGKVLTLTGVPIVAISGAHAGDFSVLSQPASSITAGGSTTFQVSFDPSVAGERTATLIIANDDADENPYNFELKGTGLATPEIEISGNGTPINDGDSSPELSDHTDFGAISTESGNIVRTFLISNLGQATLNLTGNPRLLLSGDHASDFSISAYPDAQIAPAGSSSFQITFTPAAPGKRTTLLTLANDDQNENPYTFALQGTGLATPQMSITGNGVEIINGDTTPSFTDNSDFSQTDLLHGTATRIFTIVNSGTGVLELTGAPGYVAITGPHATDFTLTTSPEASIGSLGGASSFEVTFNPLATGQRNATLTIASNDSGNSPYSFAIQGTGGSYEEIEIQGNGTHIISGANSPSHMDHTLFTGVTVDADSSSRTFTIRNPGSKTLSLTGEYPHVSITGDSTDFKVTTAPSSSIAMDGGTSDFTVSFNPTAPGIRSAVLSIANSDGDENPYTFTVQGTGYALSSVRTLPVTSLTSSSAQFNGQLYEPGYPTPMAHGFVWNKVGNPDLNDHVINLGQISSSGSFAFNLQDLSPGTTYHYSSFATSSRGTFFGVPLTFTTPQKTFCFPIQVNSGATILICM